MKGTRIAWPLWAFSLLLILAVLVAVSFLVDINTIGATGRFVWNAVVAALLASARGLDTVLAYVLRRRIWRIAGFFTTVGLGYSGSALVFGVGLALLAILYFSTKVSRVTLFWAAFILTRPLGATVGDWLDKPVAKGGLDMSRPVASVVLLVVILVLVLVLPQRAGSHPGEIEAHA